MTYHTNNSSIYIHTSVTVS